MSYRILNNRLGLLFILLALFVLNYAETRIEKDLKSTGQYELGYDIAQTFMELEGNLDFSQFDNLGEAVVIAHSLSFYILFPALLLAVIAGLLFRREITPFRVMTLGLAISYGIALIFFIFFPVPERWTFPAAHAVLLSDTWSTGWVDYYRAFRAPDNSFPSLPAAFILVMIFVCYRYRLKFKHTATCAGLAVILSSFTLGIHWTPDLMIGGFLGVFSASMAVLWDYRIVDKIKKVQPELATQGSAVLAIKPAEKKTTFISYRRETGSIMARIVQSELKKRGHLSFLDVDDLGPKQFGERLLREIESVPNFVVVLSPGTMDRCEFHDDWLRREIAHAISTQRNIVPLMVDEFEYPPKDKIPDELEELLHHNGVTYSHEYFAATFDKLSDFLQKK
ncbi:MAG: TIR domain-containing protein [Nitrospinota bacterium]|nr:TIR domain-containing protein [Nitrospinota bacterium]